LFWSDHAGCIMAEQCVAKPWHYVLVTHTSGKAWCEACFGGELLQTKPEDRAAYVKARGRKIDPGKFGNDGGYVYDLQPFTVGQEVWKDGEKARVASVSPEVSPSYVIRMASGQEVNTEHFQLEIKPPPLLEHITPVLPPQPPAPQSTKTPTPPLPATSTAPQDPTPPWRKQQQPALPEAPPTSPPPRTTSEKQQLKRYRPLSTEPNKRQFVQFDNQMEAIQAVEATARAAILGIQEIQGSRQRAEAFPNKGQVWGKGTEGKGKDMGNNLATTVLSYSNHGTGKGQEYVSLLPWAQLQMAEGKGKDMGNNLATMVLSDNNHGKGKGPEGLSTLLPWVPQLMGMQISRAAPGHPG
jgi:hypothetical protein